MEEAKNDKIKLSSEFINSFMLDACIRMVNRYGVALYNDREFIRIPFNILKTIDGIRVFMAIKIYHNGDIYAEINGYKMKYTMLMYDNQLNENKYYEECNKACSEECDEENCECVKYMLNKAEFIDLFNTIEWDKHINYIINLKYNSIIDAFISYYVSDDDLKALGYVYDECCICYNNTTYKDINGHYICNMCYEKLEKKECPLCRIRLNQVNYNLVRGGGCNCVNN